MSGSSSPDALRSRAGSTRVICLGLSALDQIWRADELFAGAGGQKVRGTSFETLGGGMAATAAVAVARLGGSATFWGRAGADPAGEEMRRLLAQEGVDVAGFRLFADGRSSVSGVVVDPSGERQIVNFRGQLPDESDWLPLAQVASASCVLADPRWVAGAEALFRAARRSGVPTILDADMAEPEVFETLLPLADHAVFSQPALARYAGCASDGALAEIAGFGCRVAAVTRGAAGVTWLVDGATRTQTAPAVEVVDTTGAGDVFHGAYALAIGVGLPVDDAMSFAAAVAALKCTRAGGRAGIPALDEALAFHRTQP